MDPGFRREAELGGRCTSQTVARDGRVKPGHDEKEK